MSLMIVGAPKSGTTSLLRYLGQHPGLVFHRQPEMTFFFLDEEYEAGYQAAAERYFGDGDRPGARCGKHVALLYSRAAVTRLHLHNPEAHLVVLLRNPVDRAYSAYWYARQRGWETEPTFEAGLEQEASRLQEGWIKWRNCAYAWNGAYEAHLRALFEVHGRSRVHTILFEDFRERPGETCRALFEALRVDPSFVPVVQARHNPSRGARSATIARLSAGLLASGSPAKRLIRRLIPDRWAPLLRRTLLRVNERPFEVPAMDPATRRRLLGEFRPANERLEALLERSVSSWDR